MVNPINSLVNEVKPEVKQSGLEIELKKLRGEKKSLMQEVFQLQQEHLATIRQVDSLNQRMQSAERRQKQMVTFLARVFQNPEFLAQIRKQKAQREIVPARAKRKFLKQHSCSSEPVKSLEQKIVDYGQCSVDVGGSSSQLGIQAGVHKPLEDNFLEDMVEKLGLDPSTKEVLLAASEHDGLEMAPLPPASDACTQEVSLQTDDSFAVTEYYVSFPEDISPEKTLSETIFPPDITMGDMEAWSTGLEIGGSSFSSGLDLWADLDQNVPELEGAAGYSELWDPVLQTLDEGLHIDEFLSADSYSYQCESQIDLPDEDSDKIDKP
ncbi:heat stress transcription factor A-3-like isoform X2 [Dioscorea cayenensis subsp. rotundata]|uniref:Heat stress transcription factor A-3-like isoform X2 n=1 Tax=Dioscorea cayennensis subsp. rotundata TaxID=55577 RepID=A0AB40C358_DIOCR|nr:heat stress transcription factor A-3-like isoform X2 [Dioscorea cayenensis subsp. rotundata]